MKLKVGDIAVVVKPKDPAKLVGWNPKYDGIIGSHVEILKAWPEPFKSIHSSNSVDQDIYTFNDPRSLGSQLAVYGDWLEQVTGGVTFMTQSGGMTTIRSSVNPSEWYPTLSEPEKSRTDREFDGHCDKAPYPEWAGWCGGFRKHKLGCPQKKKESSA